MVYYQDTYEKNRSALSDYAWWLYGQLPSFEELSEESRQLDEELYKPTKINTKPFFRDLSKPLLVKNEYNSYHFGYLVDNVRASEDFGADNHIYMYYDSQEEFCRLLQVIDITPYLTEKKIVFLIGAEELVEHYPLDFKREYGICYEIMGSKPVRVDEINRLILRISKYYSGNIFCSGILDWHKNLLTIKNFGLTGISYLYEKLFKGHTVNEVYELLLNNESSHVKGEFDALFCPWGWNRTSGEMMHVPSFDDFFEELRKMFPEDYHPLEDEWLKGMFLSYSVALGKDVNQRIAPALVFESHPHTVEITDITKNNALFKKFKYFRRLSIIRRNTMIAASMLETNSIGIHTYYKGGVAVREGSYFPAVSYVCAADWQEAPGLFYSMPNYVNEGSEALDYTAMVRFEDLKLEPKATLEAVLDFLDMEWDDGMLKTTANGSSESMLIHGNLIKDFDPAPVLKKREKMLSPYDYYRMELLMGDMMVPWGYKPQYYTDGKAYSKEEIIAMFEKPFKFEEFFFTVTQFKKGREEREKMMKIVRERVKHPSACVSPDGRKLVPIPWLKPKAEYMKGKLYE
ncbi:hypothetical protein [Anaerovibrio lipolyticus]|nr:hypothetical protein [Anaerovibrio lipolyticus]